MDLTIPRTPRIIPGNYDPARRLYCAVLVQAVRDFKRGSYDAEHFLLDNVDLIAGLAGTTPEKIVNKLIRD